MYIPKNIGSLEDTVAVQIIKDFGFGALVSPSLEATHLPLFFEPPSVDSSSSTKGYLYGHFAKANPHWEELQGQRILVIFSGPHSYISPTWYVSKPAVPTWNYVSVHCYGQLEILNDDEAPQMIDALTQQYEPELLNGTAITEQILPISVREKLYHAIVGFRIIIDAIHGKEKLGQHRSAADQAGVYQALRGSSLANSRSLAAYMENRNVGVGAASKD